VTLNSEAMKMLVDKGFTGEDLVAFALCLEKAFPVERSSGAERQARYRARKRGDATNDVTRDVTEADQVSLDKKAPQTPEKINPIPCVRGTRAWHRLPESWQPRALPQPVQAKVDQWPPGALGDELAAFRRWAANADDKNGKGRKLDWDQAWRNWIGRRHDERYSNRMGRHQPSDGLSSTARAAIAVFGAPSSGG
jgi:hypothetical protein